MATEKRPAIPVKIKTRLWMAAAGRCEFNKCNKALWRNELSMKNMNVSYIAHIYGYAPDSARYDPILSPKLKIDFTNLMLVCDGCHRTIDDKNQVNEYSASKLIQMKKEHEERIEFLSSLHPENRSHIILYGAKIGEHSSPLGFGQSCMAMLPEYYPVSPHPIELGLKNSSYHDDDSSYWSIEVENLKKLFKDNVEYVKNNHPIQHYSIFGLAPQPLLITLGTLLNDIYAATIFQLHREPQTWLWLEEKNNIEYIINEPETAGKTVALKIALSASISDERIYNVLSKKAAIWSLTIANPHNDYLRSKDQLSSLRTCFRKIFDRIKYIHGEDANLHIFPAMPVAAAIEFGRIWMPKSDLPFTIYDQNRKKGGFFKTIYINQ